MNFFGRFVFGLWITAIFAAALFIPLELLSVLRLEHAKAQAGFDLISSNSSKVESLIKTIDNSVSGIIVAEEASVNKANVFARLSDASGQPDMRIRNLCLAVSAYGEALRKRPRDARVLVRWASLRQVLGNVECGLELTSGDALNATNLANQYSPNDPAVQYLAGKIFFWEGARNEAWKSFRKLLNYSTKLEPGKRDYIASLVDNEQDLSELVPDRFPQIYEWTNKFKIERPDKFAQLSQQFSRMQTVAVLRSVEEYNRSVIPAELHRKRLLALRALAPEDIVLKLINLELARLYSSGEVTSGVADKDRSRIFSFLSQLSLQPFVAASIKSDSRPLKSSLMGWGSVDSVRVNDYYQSVGFFIPASHKAKFVELRGISCPDQLFVRNLKIYHSGNNQVWEEIPESAKPEILSFPEQCLVLLKLAPADSGYWKINFASGQREGSFYNNLDSMITVYG